MDQCYKRILVALDKAEPTVNVARAFERALNIAIRNNGGLALAHVLDASEYRIAASYDKDVVTAATTQAINFLQTYKQEALDAGIEDVEILIGYGNVKKILVHQLAEKYLPHLIVCSNKNLSQFEYMLLLGSVSTYVVHNADCDVLIIK